MSRWERLRHDASLVGIASGVLLAVAGFVVIGVTWRRLAAEPIVVYQMPLAVSGSLVGIGLVAVGGVLVNLQFARRSAARRRDRLDDLAEVLASLPVGATLPRRGPPSVTGKEATAGLRSAGLGRRGRTVLALGVAVSALLASDGPGQAAAADDVEVTSVVEAWYTTPAAQQLCAAPVCEPPSETDPLPPPLLHIGYAAGQQTDRTFVVLDLSTVPSDAAVADGELTLPLAAPPTGNVPPEDAVIVACPVYDEVSFASGTPGAGPGYVCATQVAARYEAAASPVDGHGRLVVDLQPFAAAWNAGDSPALALVPALTQALGSWRFALQGRPDAEAASPITAVLVVEEKEHDDEEKKEPPSPPDPGPEPDDTGTEPSPPATVAGGQGTGDDGLPMVPEPPVTEPEGSQEISPVAAVDESPSSGTFGFAYPGIFLLPIVALAAVALVGRSLVFEIPRLVAVDGRTSGSHPPDGPVAL